MKTKFTMLKEALKHGITKEQIKTKNFKEVNFIRFDFKDWNFSLFNFRYANFRSAYFSSADFSYAYFRSANFSSADFRYAYFSYANFSYANFRYAYFSYANFSYANFRSANFSSADFRYANFRNSDFRIKIDECTFGIVNICPDGEFIAWKKANGMIVKLKILEDSKRSNATTAKCRCDKALVLGIENIDGSKSEMKQIESSRGGNFLYKVGEIVKVDDFDTNKWNECSTGIHFFINRKLAEQY